MGRGALAPEHVGWGCLPLSWAARASRRRSLTPCQTWTSPPLHLSLLPLAGCGRVPKPPCRTRRSGQASFSRSLLGPAWWRSRDDNAGGGAVARLDWALLSAWLLFVRHHQCLSVFSGSGGRRRRGGILLYRMGGRRSSRAQHSLSGAAPAAPELLQISRGCKCNTEQHEAPPNFELEPRQFLASHFPLRHPAPHAPGMQYLQCLPLRFYARCCPVNGVRACKGAAAAGKTLLEQGLRRLWFASLWRSALRLHTPGES